MQWTDWTLARFEALLAGQEEITTRAALAVVNAEAAAAAALAATEVARSWQRYFGVALVPNGEIHVADEIGTSVTAFQMDGGAGAGGSWGAWLQILGSSDTPFIAGNITFSISRFAPTAVERADTPYLIQVSAGATGDAGVAAGTYSDLVFRSGAALWGELPFHFETERVNVGTKVWMRCWAVGSDTGTLDFFFGLREYSV